MARASSYYPENRYYIRTKCNKSRNYANCFGAENTEISEERWLTLIETKRARKIAPNTIEMKVSEKSLFYQIRTFFEYFNHPRFYISNI